MNINSNIKFFFVSLIFLSINIQCDENNKNYFPYVSVDEVLHLNSDLVDLGMLESKIVFPDEGYGGIILFKRSEEEYNAYDMACPYDTPEVCTIEGKNSSDLTWECPCCGSVYNLYNHGAVDKPPAEYPLKEYSVYIDWDKNLLFISN